MNEILYYNSQNLIDSWHIKKKIPNHSLHALSSYMGKFPPQIARYFIEHFSTPKDFVFDPFCGSGTTPLEALLLGRNGIGNDAFIVAKIISGAKLNPIPLTVFKPYLLNIQNQVEHLPEIELTNMRVAEVINENSLKELLKYREILKNDTSSEGIFLKAIICSLLQTPISKSLSIKSNEKQKEKKKFESEYPSIYEMCMEKANAILKDSLPTIKGKILSNDSRKISLSQESVDFILTSPPYMNELDYTWQNWLQIWFLNELQKNERKKLTMTTKVGEWEKFMEESLIELYRILKKNKFCVIVVGDVIQKQKGKKDKVIYNSAQRLSEIASNIGFETACIINDEPITKNKNLLERCLVISKGKPEIDFKTILGITK